MQFELQFEVIVGAAEEPQKERDEHDEPDMYYVTATQQPST